MEYGGTRSSMRNMLNELLKEANAYNLMEQQNSKKLMITDDAINAIPYVNYPGISAKK